MPELCRFYDIIIRMFWADHPPPHFHAIYGEHEALIEIQSSEIIEGSLPLGARKPFGKIEPLPRGTCSHVRNTGN